MFCENIRLLYILLIKQIILEKEKKKDVTQFGCLATKCICFLTMCQSGCLIFINSIIFY